LAHQFPQEPSSRANQFPFECQLGELAFLIVIHLQFSKNLPSHFPDNRQIKTPVAFRQRGLSASKAKKPEINHQFSVSTVVLPAEPTSCQST
jgi:hypothetical protein